MAGLIDSWTAFDDPAVTGLFMPDGPGPAAGRFTPLSAAIGWLEDRAGVLTANLHRLGADRVLVAPSRPAPGEGTHVADHLLCTLQQIGVRADQGPASIPVHVASDLAVEAQECLRGLGLGGTRFIAIHPGSGSVSKNWPPEPLAGLVERLPEATGRPALVLSGPADEDAIERLLGQLSRRPPLLQNVSLPLVAAVLQQASAYLGNDAGPTHLAAMLGTPTLALFGPTDPALWAPRGPRVRVLRHQPLSELRPEVVLGALEGVLG